MKKLVQIPLKSYLYKFAISTQHYNGEYYNLPFAFALPNKRNTNNSTSYFNKIKEDSTRQVLLTSMYRPSLVRKFGFVCWLKQQFYEQMYHILIGARAFNVNEKDCILHFLEHYQITEYDLKIDTVFKSWQRKKERLRASGQAHLIDINYDELRPSPKRRKQCWDLPLIDFQDL